MWVCSIFEYSNCVFHHNLVDLVVCDLVGFSSGFVLSDELHQSLLQSSTSAAMWKAFGVNENAIVQQIGDENLSAIGPLVLGRSSKRANMVQRRIEQYRIVGSSS